MLDRINEKLTQLAAQREQLLAQLNAVIGAEQALKQLLEGECEVHSDENSKD